MDTGIISPGNGAMQTGLVDLGEKVVYYASNGQMQYGEQKINGYWYYFKPGNGAMQTGLVDLGEKLYIMLQMAKCSMVNRK